MKEILWGGTVPLSETKRREGAASYLSPFTGDPARRRTASQAAADADRRFVVARAVGGWEGLGEVAALAQGDAVLEARPAFRRALSDGRRRRQTDSRRRPREPKRSRSLRPYLRPVQGDPLRRAGLVVARLLFDRAVGQAVRVLQRLLLGGTDPPDADDRPRPHPAVTCLPALGPVADEPPVRKQKKPILNSREEEVCSPWGLMGYYILITTSCKCIYFL